MVKISFRYKDKKISVEARKCGFFSTGLMFRTRSTKPCLFEYKKRNEKMSSLFVFFPFIGIWIDSDGRVTNLRRINPFTFSFTSKKRAAWFLEIPINKKNSRILQLLDGN
jgi:uncharacterized membrane protein (UPF0127 family)